MDIWRLSASVSQSRGRHETKKTLDPVGRDARHLARMVNKKQLAEKSIKYEQVSWLPGVNAPSICLAVITRRASWSQWRSWMKAWALADQSFEETFHQTQTPHRYPKSYTHTLSLVVCQKTEGRERDWTRQSQRWPITSARIQMRQHSIWSGPGLSDK